MHLYRKCFAHMKQYRLQPFRPPPKFSFCNTAILKLRLRATLEFGTFLPPLQLLNLMAKASMDRYHYLPKKADPDATHWVWEGFNLA